MRDNWPPSDESPYEDPAMQNAKPGNFFTIASEDHPAYDLFEALYALGWEYDISNSRHWIHMANGDAYLSASLWGQGSFGCRNDYGEYGVGFEDRENIWTDALPHIAKFMRIMTEHDREFREKAKKAAEKIRTDG